MSGAATLSRARILVLDDNQDSKCDRQARRKPAAYAAHDAPHEPGRVGSSLRTDLVQKYEKGTNRMGASRLQHAAHILDVPVPFFFEGAPGQQAEDGTAPSPSYVNEFVSSEDGLRLIKAFMRIARTVVRRRVVELVQEIARN